MRNVSWSETFETLEHDETLETRDGTFGGTFETRDDGTFEGTYDLDEADSSQERQDEGVLVDFNWVYNGDTMGTFVTKETYDRSEDVETFEAGTMASMEEVSQEKEQEPLHTPTKEIDQPTEDKPVDNNENLEPRNLASASIVSDATELTDKYGLNEVWRV
jgi:hypothetical protein